MSLVRILEGIGKEIVICFWLGYLKVLATGLLYGFAIMIVTILWVAGVLGTGFAL